MEGNSITPSMDMNQYRYLKFYIPHTLILNYHEKVSGYVPQKFWSFLVISEVFLEFSKIKSSPKTGVSQITKYLKINPILTSHNYIQKIIASIFVKLSYLHKQVSYAATKIYYASDDIT
jgi:hypothetical protein